MSYNYRSRNDIMSKIKLFKKENKFVNVLKLPAGEKNYHNTGSELLMCSNSKVLNHLIWQSFLVNNINRKHDR